MGKPAGDSAASDSSDNERKETMGNEQKSRAKRKKRKRSLDDLHQRLHKSRTVCET
ncbi:hypothetical protein WN55_04052 [Dufourea novaeangliae]|uniref:Uncharacterized protein n=1 Tax=Dufourea novaeangliae TaxID=178035 RepID=A0A154NWQ1_DUFNO|nr:hypothetical protein WN55_04052 [Dufourea novaeangliae]